MLFFGGFCFAEDNYTVELEIPKTFNINEAVDFSLTVLKNGTKAKQYEGAFSMTLKNTATQKSLAKKSYEIADGWFIEIDKSNAWEVNFQKGLQIFEPWTYEIKVENLDNDEFFTTKKIQVLWEMESEVHAITITNPINGITVNKSEITILADCKEAINSAAIILLNGEEEREHSFDENGNLKATFYDLQEGENTLSIKVEKLDGTLQSQSDQIIFYYEPSAWGWLENFVMTPENGIVLGQKVKFQALVDENATSVSMSFNGGSEIFFTKERDGVFSVNQMVDTTGDITISINIVSLWEKKVFSDIKTFTVKDSYNGIFLSPDTWLVLGSTSVIQVNVENVVSEVFVQLNDQNFLSLEKNSEGVFEKEVLFDMTGDVILNVKTVSEGVTSLYENVKMLFVDNPKELQPATLEITPYTWVIIGDTINFEAKVDPMITKVVLTLSWEDMKTQTVELVKEGESIFTKSTTAMFTGNVSVTLMANGENEWEVQMVPQIKTYYVDDVPTIGNVKFSLDENSGSLIVDWEVLGNAPQFRVFYGLSWDDFKDSVDTKEPNVVFQNLDTRREYYFKIIPLVGQQEDHASATDVYVYKPPYRDPKVSDVSIIKGYACVVKGIRVRTEKIGRSYYLVWDDVPNATSYVVYSSDTKDWKKKTKLVETSSTRYEYPFDYTVEDPVYAYFWVEAVCSDNSVVSLTDAQKVQVGPAQNLMIIVILSLFVYAWIKLYRYTE